MTQRLALLGSTGSIGESALEVVRHHPDRLTIETLATFGRKLDELERQTLAAGFARAETRLISELERDGRMYPLFLLTAQRP